MPPHKAKDARKLKQRTLISFLHPHRTLNLRVNETTSLPGEILLEIISHLDLPCPSEYPFESQVIEEYNYMSDSFVTEHAVSGLDAVRALSQTCRAWREFFLPMLWESVEVGMVNDEMKGVWYKVCSERLERVGNGIAGCGEVAELVRKMRVVITQSNIDKAMPAFTSALKACVNLETINIHFADRAAGKHFNKGFPHGTVFPTIKALVIPAYAHALLRACPNVRRVVCNRGEVTPKLVTAIKSAGKNVQVLHGLHMEHTLLKRLAKAVPNLGEIAFAGCLPTSEYLVGFQNVVSIHARERGSEEVIDTKMNAHLENLKGVLKPGCVITIHQSLCWHDQTKRFGSKKYHVSA